ncbi:response regulator transcription factor [Streptomyces diastaticus]|uniref:response regulator transcription factor n=1 Tax=Streptomyces diastaticus TaxID=1956 RepID=UPI0036590CC7
MIERLREVVCTASGREREVLGHIARGATYREIARRMDVSLHTVDTYVRRIRAKTGARNRTHLLLLALSLEGSLESAIEDMGLPAVPKAPGRPPVRPHPDWTARAWPPDE